MDADAKKVLIDALRSTGSYENLGNFLDLELDRGIADIVAPTALGDAAQAVVQAAVRDRWVGDLVHAASARWSADHALRGLRRTLPRDTIPDVAVADLANYDMQEHTSRFEEAWYDADGNRVVATAIVCDDERFLGCLCQRLAGITGGEPQGGFTLNLTTSSPTAVLTRLRLLDRLLERRAVVLPVRVNGQGDAASLVTELWTGLSAHPIGGTQQLFMVLTVDPAVLPALPEGVFRLPPPAVERGHLTGWARQLGEVLGWSEPLRRNLVERIHGRVMAVEGESARLYALYAELDMVLRDLKTDLASVIAELEAA